MFLLLAVIIFGAISIVPVHVNGANLAVDRNRAPALGTPHIGMDGRVKLPAASSLNHWWLIDYWDASFLLPGTLPSRQSGQFDAVANTIQGLQTNDDILYLPLNVAYGTSSSNCVWFQFDVDFSASGQVAWYIWDVNCPGTNQNMWPNGDYHPTTIGLSYVVGDRYSFAITTSGSNTVTFSINDTSNGASWSKSDWVWSVPSTTMLATESTFSPSSAVEGYTSGSALTGVPLLFSKMGEGIQSNRSYPSGTGMPSGISTTRFALDDSSHWMWAMSPSLAPVHLDIVGSNPTSIGLVWGQSGYAFFNRYEVQRSILGFNGPWTTVDKISAKTNTTDLVTGLLPSHTYWWRIVTFDCCGATANSNTQRMSQPGNPILSAVLSGDTSLNLTWTNNAGYGGMISFSSYQLLGLEQSTGFAIVVNVNSVTNRTITLKGLHFSTSYSFSLVTSDVCDGCVLQGTSRSGSTVLPLTMPDRLIASASVLRGTADVGQSGLFVCRATGGVPGVAGYSYSWEFGDGGHAVTQGIVHSYISPGTLIATCAVTDIFGGLASASTSVVVSTDPSILAPMLSRVSADIGQTVELSTQAGGGSGGYVYGWQSLPLGCYRADTPFLSCQLRFPGTFIVGVDVTDSNGFTTVSDQVTFTVYPDPIISGLTSSATSLDLGQKVTIVADATGGAGSLTYSYSGLPSGCSNANTAVISCTPGATGIFVLSVSVIDSNGFTVTGHPLAISVSPNPTIIGIYSSTESVSVGQGFSLTVSAAGGTGALHYSYSGLPVGCVSADTAVLHCSPSSPGSYKVQATVTDQLGQSATSSMNIVVNRVEFFGTSQGYAVIAGAIVAAALAVATLLRRKRKSGHDTVEDSSA